ncbi:MAG TPA: SoxR reducing system RseC family protein [Ignavibacteriaceae bacterium]|nr:SoxR reducing system RseC family protein [Ignavibacteriaceae bacterium]
MTASNMYTEELYEEGIVKEAKNGIAIIRIQDSEKCGECTAKIYCKPGRSDERSLTVRDPYGVHPGDKVRVVIKGSKILSASFLLYGIPVIILISGLLIGMQIFNNNKELFSTLLSFGFISIYMFFVFIFSKRNTQNASSYPEITFVKTIKN